MEQDKQTNKQKRRKIRRFQTHPNSKILKQHAIQEEDQHLKATLYKNKSPTPAFLENESH
jgi:hypothetical protein